MAGPSMVNLSTSIDIGPVVEAKPPVKLCKDCRHAHLGAISTDWDGSAICWRDPQLSLITGKHTSYRFCINERNHIGACGPEARFFEERG